MACFITPLLAGIVTSILGRIVKGANKLKLNVLMYLLLGGSLVLALEHVWHGEVVPYPPFLTAMQNPEDIPVMLHEISMVGGSMTIAVVGLWLGIVWVSKKLEVKISPPVMVTTTLRGQGV